VAVVAPGLPIDRARNGHDHGSGGCRCEPASLNWLDAAAARTPGEDRSVHVPDHRQLRLWVAHAHRSRRCQLGAGPGTQWGTL